MYCLGVPVGDLDLIIKIAQQITFRLPAPVKTRPSSGDL